MSKGLRAAALSLFFLFLIHLVCDPRERSPWSPKWHESAHRARYVLPAATLPSLTLLSSAKALKHLGFVPRLPQSPALHWALIICSFTVTVIYPTCLSLCSAQGTVQCSREAHIDKLQCWFFSALKSNTGDNSAKSYVRQNVIVEIKGMLANIWGVPTKCHILC